MPFLTKKFTFCAAHQYGHSDWSSEKNEEVFGDDARLHGHNYDLEVSLIILPSKKISLGSKAGSRQPS